MSMIYTYTPSPLGDLLLAGRLHGKQGQEELHFIGFPDGKEPEDKGIMEPKSDWVEQPGAFTQAAEQLQEYFAGQRKHFDLNMCPGGTPFQLSVLAALQAIPYGETRSYLDIAKTIGRPKAVRAVGAANGRNPLPIVIPCHRVIGANGSLTGFGGGLDAKAFLLAHEATYS